MIRALVQKLGLDKIGDVLGDEARRIQVEVLRDERDILAKMIARLDERIAALGGKRRGRPPKATSSSAIAATPTRRPRRKRMAAREPGETLQYFVLRAFRNACGPIKVAHLVKRVRQLGYRTVSNSQNLLLRMYRVLRDENTFRKVGVGSYELALPKRPRVMERKRRARDASARYRAKRPRAKRAAAEQPPTAAPQTAPFEEKA